MVEGRQLGRPTGEVSPHNGMGARTSSSRRASPERHPRPAGPDLRLPGRPSARCRSGPATGFGGAVVGGHSVEKGQARRRHLRHVDDAVQRRPARRLRDRRCASRTGTTSRNTRSASMRPCRSRRDDAVLHGRDTRYPILIRGFASRRRRPVSIDPGPSRNGRTGRPQGASRRSRTWSRATTPTVQDGDAEARPERDRTESARVDPARTSS